MSAASPRYLALGRAAPRLALAVAAVIVLGGCAQRQLTAAPTSPPSGLTWTAVWTAAALASVVAGVLLTLPAWRSPAASSRFAVAVLTLQSGAVAVAAAVLVGLAVRSWQLIERPATDLPAPALVRLSAIDGDTAFFALMVLVVVVLGGALVALLALVTRLAAHADGFERLAAGAVLAIEVGACSYGAARFALGARWWPYQAATIALAPLVLALITSWPRRSDTRARRPPPAATLAR